MEVALVEGGNPGYQFSVDGLPFSALERREGIAPGAHTFVVRDKLGCELRKDFSIIGPPDFLIALGPDRNIQLGDTLHLQTALNNPALRYTWTARPALAQPLAGSSNQIIQPSQNTSIELTVRDTITGCSSRDLLQVFVDQVFHLYAPNAFSPNGDKHNDYFLLYTKNQAAQIKVFRIFDRYGNLLFERQHILPNDESAGWDGTFQGQAMNIGTYTYFATIEQMDGKIQIVKGTVNLLR